MIGGLLVLKTALNEEDNEVSVLVPTNLMNFIAYTIVRRFGNAIRTFFFD